MHHLTPIFIACAALLAGCDGMNPKPDHLIMGEGSAASDGLTVTHGNVIVKDNQPGIAFAFVSKPGNSKTFTYFLVFNHEKLQENVGVETGSTSNGSNGSTFHTITAFGNNCKVAYRVALTEDTKTVETESTSIADKPYDSSKGKLFLIDMKTNPPTVTQLNLELPSEFPNLKETDATEKFGQETLNGLRKADKTVDEFCKRIEAKGT